MGGSSSLGNLGDALPCWEEIRLWIKDYLTGRIRFDVTTITNFSLNCSRYIFLYFMHYY